MMSTTSDRTTCRKPTNCSMSSTALADSDRAGRNDDQRERHELESSVEESEPSVESEEFEPARSSDPADAEDDASLGAGSGPAPVCVLALLLSDGAAEKEEGAAETAGVAAVAAAVAAECIEAIRTYGMQAQASLYEWVAAAAVAAVMRGCSRKEAATGCL